MRKRTDYYAQKAWRSTLDQNLLTSRFSSTWTLFSTKQPCFNLKKKKKRRRGGDICSLLFCSKSRTGSISLHHAPKYPEIRKKLYNFVAKTRQNISDLKTFHICSEHFTNADYLIPPVVAASSESNSKQF